MFPLLLKYLLPHYNTLKLQQNQVRSQKTYLRNCRLGVCNHHLRPDDGRSHEERRVVILIGPRNRRDERAIWILNHLRSHHQRGRRHRYRPDDVSILNLRPHWVVDSYLPSRIGTVTRLAHSRTWRIDFIEARRGLVRGDNLLLG